MGAGKTMIGRVKRFELTRGPPFLEVEEEEEEAEEEEDEEN